MTTRKDPQPLFDDIERPHPVVAESVGDAVPSQPLSVRMGDSWSDVLQAGDQSKNSDAPRRSASAVPLLDDMKGILQWD